MVFESRVMQRAACAALALVPEDVPIDIGIIAFVRKVTCSAEVADSIPIGSQLVVLLGLPVLVEHDLAKVGVAGSGPVFRSLAKSSMRLLFCLKSLLPKWRNW